MSNFSIVFLHDDKIDMGLNPKPPSSEVDPITTMPPLRGGYLRKARGQSALWVPSSQQILRKKI